jgi:hypothetical protein
MLRISSSNVTNLPTSPEVGPESLSVTDDDVLGTVGGLVVGGFVTGGPVVTGGGVVTGALAQTICVVAVPTIKGSLAPATASAGRTSSTVTRLVPICGAACESSTVA